MISCSGVTQVGTERRGSSDLSWPTFFQFGIVVAFYNVGGTMGRTFLPLLLLSFAVSSLPAVQPHSANAREYRHKTFGKRAVATHAAASSAGYGIHHSPAWGKGAGGYGKYVGAHMGGMVVKNSLQYGIGGLRKENYHYTRSGKHGFFPRTAYALKRTVYVPRKNRPGHTVAAGRIAGNVGGGVATHAVVGSVAGGVATGGIGLGVDAGANVAREFWPHKHHRRTAQIHHLKRAG